MIVKDELEIAKKSNLRSLLSKNEKIIFSATLTKINKNQKFQDRNMIISSTTFYNIRSEGMLASVTSLFNSSYMIKRKFDLKLIKAVVYAKLGNEFTIHVPTEFDYRFTSERKDEIIMYILYALSLNGVKELLFFFANEIELDSFTTHNSQKKKGQLHLPRGEERMISIESFEEYVKEKLRVQLEMDQATTMFISSGNKMTISDFNLLKTLGKGGFGKVYLVEQKATKKLYALKTIKKLFIIEKKQFEQVKREKEILYEAKHPFLVGLQAAFQTPDKLFFLMPFVQGGDLYAQLKRRKSFSEEEVRFFVAQIIEALGFLHTKDIIYQDIKPENLLLDVNGYIKLADFGAAKYVSQTKNYKTFVGTADYIAPEVLKKLPYTKSVDWWGLGILIFELLYGRTPFFNKNTKISFRMILSEKPVFPEGQKEISEDCKNFIEQLLNKDHIKRLGAAKEDNLEIRKHPWLSSINFEKLLRYELPAPIVPEVADELDVENFNSKYTSERPKMTMLNEEIVKELAKYDELFNGFSYNDIIPERQEDEEEKEEELGEAMHPHEQTPHADGNKSVSSSDDSEDDVAKLEDKLKHQHQGGLPKPDHLEVEVSSSKSKKKGSSDLLSPSKASPGKPKDERKAPEDKKPEETPQSPQQQTSDGPNPQEKTASE